MSEKIEKILCATIGSQSCKRAEDKAIDLAVDNKAELTFLYVVDSSFMDSVAVEIHGQSEVDSGLTKIGDIILEKAKKKAKAKKINAKTLIKEGTANDVIKNAVKETQTDLLVIGNEKRSWINEFLIKSSVGDFVKNISNDTGVAVVVVE